MKTSSKLIIAAVAVIAALALTYCLVNRAPSADAAPNEQVLAILTDGGCVSCHSAEPELPFYATWPVAGDLVQKDAAGGYLVFDVTRMMADLSEGRPLHEVDLAKLERVAAKGNMPLAKYYLVHWGSSITQAKSRIILDYVKAQRKEMAAHSGMAPEMMNEPIRPIADSLPVDARKVVLGDLLYHDVRLSKDNTVSCASCHGLNTGGVDNKAFSEGVGGQLGGVNAPTVYNSVYNFVQFWDGRAATLAHQAAGPPLNPVEMACESFDEIIAKLAADKELTKAFTAVYADGWTQENITDAIAAFETTLLTPNSRFDRYLKGDASAMSAEEVEGYRLFKQYDCATCHVGENMGGLSYERMGTAKDYFAARGTELTHEDNGRYKETQLEWDRHRFKVPGLRNIALTYPYYHDATMKTMEDAVRNMAEYESGVVLKDEEVNLIVAFFHSLTGEYQGKLLTNDNDQP